MKLTHSKLLYQEIILPVSHSVYRPFDTMPGLIRITFHLHDKNVMIQRNYNTDENNLSWVEVDNGETELAKTLGGIYELFFRDNDMVSIDIDQPENKTLAFKN